MFVINKKNFKLIKFTITLMYTITRIQLLILRGLSKRSYALRKTNF